MEPLTTLFKNHFYFNWLHKKAGYAAIFNVGSGLFFWLFLWIAVPFGLYNNNLENTFYLGLFLLPLGLVWSGICYLGDWLFKKWRDTDNVASTRYSFFSWVIRLIVLIHFIYFIREALCSWQCIDLKEYFEIWFACAILFTFCYVPYSLYGRYLFFHSLVGLEKVDSGSYTLKGEGKESLTINPDQIIYIQSSDNYVDIFLAQETHAGKKIVFRCTLKSVEEQLSGFPQFVRIHRTVIVNTRYISSTAGWSTKKQITVSFLDYRLQLPISRSYAVTLTNLFTRPK